MTTGLALYDKALDQILSPERILRLERGAPSVGYFGRALEALGHTRLAAAALVGFAIYGPK